MKCLQVSLFFAKKNFIGDWLIRIYFKDKTTREKISQLDRKLKVLNSKISELSQDSKEHGLVLNAFEKVDPNRRCFRVIGGVMVERTVKTVKPALEKEKSALDSAISELEKQYESTEQELKSLIENLNTASNSSSSEIGVTNRKS